MPRLQGSEEKKCEEQDCEHRSERRRGGGTPGTRAEIPLQPVEDTVLEQVFPRGTAAPGESIQKQIFLLKVCSPQRTAAWSRGRA